MKTNEKNEKTVKKEDVPQIYKPYHLTGQDYLTAFFVFLVALGVYVYTMAPGICTKDTGELSSATFFLGNAHSPGYPLFCVVGKFFMNSLPFLGQAIYRLNFFAGWAGAMTIAGLYLLLAKLLGRIFTKEEETLKNEISNQVWIFTRLPAVAGALYMAFSQIFWSQSILAEVYTLQSIFIPYQVLLLLKWDELILENPSLLSGPKFYWNDASRLLYAFYFLLGFSMGNHHTTLGFVMPTFIFIISRYLKANALRWGLILVSLPYFSVMLNILKPIVPLWIIIISLLAFAIILLSQSPRSVGVFLIAGLFMALGLCIYAYLPIRGEAYAPLHWGIPTTWERFSNVVLRKQYSGMTQSGDLFTFTYRIQQVWIWFTWRVQQWGIVIFLLIIPGLYNLFRKNKRWFWFSLSYILYYDFGLLIFNNFQFSGRDQYFANIFWIISYINSTIWLAYGVQFLAELAVKWSQKTNQFKPAQAGFAVALAFVLLAGLPFSSNFAMNNYRHNSENHNYGLNMLRTLEKESVLFTEGGDNQVFSLLYLHLVEHLRPDTHVWDQKGNVFEGLYGDLMHITSDKLFENTVKGDFSQWDTGRPMYYTWKDMGRINEINKRYITTPAEKTFDYTWIQEGATRRLNKTWGKGVALPARTFEPVGILYKIIPYNQEYFPLIDYWSYYHFPWLTYGDEAVHWDYLTREIVANYNFQLGDTYLMKSDEYKQAWYSQPRPAQYNSVPASQFLQKSKEYEDRGFQYYEDAAKFGFDMTAIHFNFAVFLEQKAGQYVREGNIPEAMKLYDRAIAKYSNAMLSDKEEIRAYNNWAMAFERKAELDFAHEGLNLSNAARVLMKGLKAVPHDQNTRNNLNRIQGKQKYPLSVIQHLQSEINHNLTRTNVDKLMTALTARGENGVAAQFLEQVIRYFPKDFDLLGKMVNISAQAQDWDKALKYLAILQQLQPQNPYIPFNMAEFNLRKGQYQKAAADFSRFLQMAQNDPRMSKEITYAQNVLMQMQNAPQGKQP